MSQHIPVFTSWRRRLAEESIPHGKAPPTTMPHDLDASGLGIADLHGSMTQACPSRSQKHEQVSNGAKGSWKVPRKYAHQAGAQHRCRLGPSPDAAPAAGFASPRHWHACSGLVAALLRPHPVGWIPCLLLLPVLPGPGPPPGWSLSHPLSTCIQEQGLKQPTGAQSLATSIFLS